MPASVADLIDAARVRHWSFTDLQLSDGAACLFLNQRQRTHLGADGPDLEGLIGTAMSYNLQTIGGVLVAVDPVTLIVTTLTTYQDGFPIQFDPITGIPFVDNTQAPIATDPFGAHGGTPGFPLPADMIRLINVMAVYNNPPGQLLPIDVVNERQRNAWLPGRNPAVFVSGNRLVPMLAFSGATQNSADRWMNVTSLQLSYIAMKTLAALADVVTLPQVLVEALIADLSALMAAQSKQCTAADRAGFRAEAADAAAKVAAASLEILAGALQESVLYRE